MHTHPIIPMPDDFPRRQLTPTFSETAVSPWRLVVADVLCSFVDPFSLKAGDKLGRFITGRPPSGLDL